MQYKNGLIRGVHSLEGDNSEILDKKSIVYKILLSFHQWGKCSLNIHLKGCRGCDRMVVGFTTAYAISAYHLW
jgi:hypothetical protein